MARDGIAATETLIGPREIDDAASRIGRSVVETPIEESVVLSAETGCKVFLKLENFQRSGSFKARGALNAVLQNLGKQVVAASSGNHGAAVAWALDTLRPSAPPHIFVSQTAAPHRIERLRRMGAIVEVVGRDAIDAEQEARQRAQCNGWHYISPYNDLQVIAGQGTVARELVHQCDPLDAVFVAVGGGGLIGGMGAYLKERSPATKIIGCSPERSSVMARSVRAGEIQRGGCLPTLSDATAGGVEAGSVTFPLCRDLVDDWVDVTEEEIAAGVDTIFRHHQMHVEGAAGVAVAGALRWASRHSLANIAIVLCGSSSGSGVVK